MSAWNQKNDFCRVRWVAKMTRPYSCPLRELAKRAEYDRTTSSCTFPVVEQARGKVRGVRFIREWFNGLAPSMLEYNLHYTCNDC